MRAFLARVGIMAASAAIILTIIAFVANGSSDPFYRRFTTPTQHSMILGTSRAAQGIRPAEFDDLLGHFNFAGPLYNFSFTNLHSPYGAAYLRAIRKKLSPDTRNGIFILVVDPWSISSIEQLPAPRESASFIGRLKCYSCQPNLEYLIHYFQNRYIAILFNLVRTPSMAVQPDGWLKVNIPMDEVSIRHRTLQKLEDYEHRQLPRYQPSAERLMSLHQTIEFLEAYGQVVLVRLPVPTVMLDLENRLMPDFDEKIEKTARQYNLPYYNYVEENHRYIFTDGNHLSPDAAARFSRELASRMRRSLDSMQVHIKPRE